MQLPGSDGVFLTPSGQVSTLSTPVKWFPRSKDESLTAYFGRVERDRGGKPLAWRKGGGAFLGARLPKDPTDVGLAFGWKVRNVPSDWTEHDVAGALSGAGWTEVAVKTTPQFRRQPWVIKGRNPGAFGAEVAAVQVGPDVFLTLEKMQAHGRKEPSSNFLRSRACPGMGQVDHQEVAPHPKLNKGSQAATSRESEVKESKDEAEVADRERPPRRGQKVETEAKEPVWAPDPRCFLKSLTVARKVSVVIMPSLLGLRSAGVMRGRM